MKKGLTLRSHPLTGINVFLLIALFAVMSLLTVLLSVQCYAGITSDVTADSDARMLTGYLHAKVRAADYEEGASLKDMDGLTVLCLPEDGLENLIYVDGGWLCEQLCDPSDEFDPEMGERLVEAAALTGQTEGRLMTLRVTDGTGSVHTVVCALHAGGGDTP